MAAKKKKALVSWLGLTDIDIITGLKPSQTPGPLHSILLDDKYGPFDRLVLFWTPDIYGERMSQGLKAIQREAEKLRCDFFPMPVENLDIVAPDAVYDAMYGELIGEYGENGQYEVYFNLSSGTHSMYAAQLHLCAAVLKGTALYTVDAKFNADKNNRIREVSLPYELSRIKGNLESSLIVGANREIFELIPKIANDDVPVLILGETGTGKSLLAQYIHEHDAKRSKKEMITVNCGNLGSTSEARASELFGHIKGSYTGALKDREGAFQQANGSTIFLDEIGELPYEHQAGLLRAIGEKKIKPLGAEKEIATNARIIAATNVDLGEAVRNHLFRSDLFYRLAVFAPRLAAFREYGLEEKKEAITKILAGINKRKYPGNPRSLSAEAMNMLLAHSWPGNLREISLRLESACLLCGPRIDASDLRHQMQISPAQFTNGDNSCWEGIEGAEMREGLPANLESWTNAMKRHWIKEALKRFPSNKEAARSMGLAATTFASMKKKLLPPDEDA